MIMKEYIVQLPNEKAKTYQVVTAIILLINLLALGMFSINTPDPNKIIWGGMTMSMLALLYFAFNFYTKRLSPFRTGISFIVIAIFWILVGKYLLAAFILLFAIAGFFTSRKFNVIFSADKILYPSFPVKTFLWDEVSNVILKDNVLTIDLKNNKLIQSVIEKVSADEIDENDFNKFCREQMNLTAKSLSR